MANHGSHPWMLGRTLDRQYDNPQAMPSQEWTSELFPPSNYLFPGQTDYQIQPAVLNPYLPLTDSSDQLNWENFGSYTTESSTDASERNSSSVEPTYQSQKKHVQYGRVEQTYPEDQRAVPSEWVKTWRSNGKDGTGSWILPFVSGAPPWLLLKLTLCKWEGLQEQIQATWIGKESARTNGSIYRPKEQGKTRCNWETYRFRSIWECYHSWEGRGDASTK